MGIEDGIKNIQQMTLENKQSLNKIQDFVSTLQGIQDPSQSIQNLSMVLLNFEEKLEQSNEKMRGEMNSILELVDSSRISTGLQSSIESLPQMILSLEESLGTILSTFEKTSEETKNDLKFIKVSYVEDVVGNMRNLSKEIIDKVNSSNDRTTALYEASVGHFGEIVEKLNNIESSLNALVENQADQLATVADLRDRVSAIIQVELASLRDRIAIYLETTINELKTSVTERLAVQDGTLQKLTKVTKQLTQNIAALPEVIKQQIDSAVETRVTAELASMKKEMKKMTALIIQATKRSS
ncbi:MAG: hypothetical protein JSW11_03445 [Candidatus Heimdallarchaeota archaeon]|nr:MAG: hypothetical protein JSW11_03445 [Candidatus Heimdallarchaeota archaeon]